MQLIRADEGFRLLRDLAVFGGRKQLRADGRVENVEKDAPQRGGSGAVGLVADNVTECRR